MKMVLNKPRKPSRMVLFFSHTSRRNRALAFSLVEVAIAVAIAAVGLATVLGVLPGGLASVREAGNVTAKARIVSEILGELQLTDWGGAASDGKTRSATQSGWDGLDAAIAKRWYFDDQANPLLESDQDFDSRISYVARVRLSTNQVMVPGDVGGSSNLKNVTIDVASIPDKSFDFDTTRKNAFTTHTGIITRRYSTK